MSMANGAGSYGQKNTCKPVWFGDTARCLHTSCWYVPEKTGKMRADAVWPRCARTVDRLREWGLMRVVIETPFAGDIERNMRFAMWCLRAAWQVDRVHGFATHLVCPWFLDDMDPDERQTGIDWEWAWQPGVPHWFFTDLAFSTGMRSARKICSTMGIPIRDTRLEIYEASMFERFELGDWPPGTSTCRIVAGQRTRA